MYINLLTIFHQRKSIKKNENQKTYHTISTVQKFTCKIVERGNIEIPSTNTHKHDR